MSGDKCGCGSCTPSRIQWLANPKLFVLSFSLIRVVDFAIRSYTNSSLTILERQFRLSSSESGLFAILNDLAQVSIIVFVSYFGYKYHRPRVIGVGFIITAIGFLAFSVPHFIEDPIDTSTYSGLVNTNVNQQVKQQARLAKFICVSEVQNDFNNTGDQSDNCKSDTTVSASTYAWPVLGQLLVGFGSAFTGPLMVTYLADAVGKRRLFLYLAFTHIGATLGIMCGLVLSSYTNSKYVDFDRIAPEDIPDIPQNDTRWIGAWWLGYIIGGFPMILLSIPMFFFPRTMSPYHAITNEQDSEMLKENGTTEQKLLDNAENRDIIDVLRTEAEKVGFAEVVRGLLPALRRVVSNIPLWLIIFAGIFRTAFTAAMQSNLVKFMVYQYNFSVSRATLFLLAIVPLTIFAHFISAIIIKRHKFDAKKCMLMLTIIKFAGAVIFSGVLFTGCPTKDVAGYTVPYQNDVSVPDTNIIPLCKADCSCKDGDFFPVCGNNGVTYTTPCNAGCTSFNFTINENNKTKPIFNDCSCLEQTGSDTPSSATSGFCSLETGCKKYFVYVLLLFLSMFLAAMSIQLFTYAVLCVSAHEDRAVSLGFEDAIPKLVGNLPAPVYVGAIINSTCQLWQTTCGERGNCYIFDMDKYRLRFHGLLVCLTILSGVMTAICYYVLKSTHKPDQKQEEKENGIELNSSGTDKSQQVMDSDVPKHAK